MNESHRKRLRGKTGEGTQSRGARGFIRRKAVNVAYGVPIRANSGIIAIGVLDLAEKTRMLSLIVV